MVNFLKLVSNRNSLKSLTNTVFRFAWHGINVKMNYYFILTGFNFFMIVNFVFYETNWLLIRAFTKGQL